MREECLEAVYSEEYMDFIADYSGDDQDIENEYGVTCYQMLAGRYLILYSNQRRREELQRAGASLPRCFGLLSSEEILEATGVAAVQRVPGLNLFGQGVMIGIIDTGAGVRKEVQKHFRMER